jgi:hypothetical protein
MEKNKKRQNNDDEISKAEAVLDDKPKEESLIDLIYRSDRRVREFFDNRKSKSDSSTDVGQKLIEP